MTFDLASVDSFKTWKLDFVLDASHWQKMEDLPLVWERLEFSEKNKTVIPEKHGIYAFVISADLVGAPPNNYVMYIGITGSKGQATRHLRKRFSEYLREEKVVKRKHIYYLLNKWKGSLSFCYAIVEKEFSELPRFEKILNDALVPPANKDDFGAEIKAVAGAAF